MSEKIYQFFKLREKGTNIRTELAAGLTTFLVIAYILAVNPAVLKDAGMPVGGVFVATALASCVGSAMMAFWANYPFVLAPGMGLNAYFTYSVVLGLGVSWQFALLMVFIEGVVFYLMTVFNIREALFNAVPKSLKHAVGAGIGMFIAFIGLQNGKVVVPNESTQVAICDFNGADFHTAGISAILTCVGAVLIAIMICRKTRGAILYGILIVWALAIAAQLCGVYRPDAEAGFASAIPNLEFRTIFDSFREFGTICGAIFNPAAWTATGTKATGFPLLLSGNFIAATFAFLFVDLFDSIGTIMGLSARYGMLDEKGRLPGLKKGLYADSLGTAFGAIFGTSTTTTYSESSAGITAGGKTGLTAATVAALFLASLVFAPVFLSIPAFATAPVLIVVGFYMVADLALVDFNELRDALPAFICVLATPLLYSISDGIAFALISWTLINAFTGRAREISPTMWILSALFVVKYAFL